ncbi:MAG: universal stress protein [Cyclobacteriaceae bacterium]|nr:universal stress protein [Cyclobacteriaceae bacterium]
MAKFKRILFPVNGNESALKYAVDMAKQYNAKLFLLHTYRLIDLQKQFENKGTKSLKRTIDDSFEEEFEKKYGHRFVAADIDYEFLIEIGFLTDRIVANIKEKNIDMLLLEGLVNNNDDSLMERFAELNIPVLLIPDTIKSSTNLVF